MRSSTIRSLSGPPSTLAAEVVRTRLVSVLDARFDRLVTTIVAGAGFGKTTLLAQAMRRNLAAPLGIDGWVSCQPDDQDPACFVAACCRAAGVEPVGTVARSTDVLAAMRDMSPIDVCLLIDDVHELIGSESETLLNAPAHKARADLSLDEDNERFGQYAVLRHRLGRGRGLHRGLERIHVGHVHKQGNMGRVPRVDQRPDVSDAERPRTARASATRANDPGP